MNTLTNPLTLSRATLAVLNRIRAGAANPLLGATSATAETALRNRIIPLLQAANLPRLTILYYGWFLRELAGLWRSRTGPDLAFHLELSIRKWVGLGLQPDTLQLIIREIFRHLNP